MNVLRCRNPLIFRIGYVLHCLVGVNSLCYFTYVGVFVYCRHLWKHGGSIQQFDIGVRPQQEETFLYDNNTPTERIPNPSSRGVVPSVCMCLCVPFEAGWAVGFRCKGVFIISWCVQIYALRNRLYCLIFLWLVSVSPHEWRVSTLQHFMTSTQTLPILYQFSYSHYILR